MRKEASLGEWKKLYDSATRIKQLAPWNDFWEVELIAIGKEGEIENTIFYSILGKGGISRGVVVYEGYEAFNNFMLMLMHDELNLSVEYTAFKQKNLACYWGHREQISPQQYDVIEKLGHKYRGRNNWLYFLANEPDFYPCELNKEEVVRMNTHLENLEMVFKKYKEREEPIVFDAEAMLLFELSDDDNVVSIEKIPFPLESYRFSSPKIDDDKLIDELKKAQRSSQVLEADIRPLGFPVFDEEYDKPLNPAFSIIVDARSGGALASEINYPEDDPEISLVGRLLDIILSHGVPIEIKVSNPIMKSMLKHISTICRFEVRVVHYLENIEKYWKSFLN